MIEDMQLLNMFVFAGVAVSLVLTLVLNGVMLLLIYMLKSSVDALRETVEQQTRLIEFVGRAVKEV